MPSQFEIDQTILDGLELNMIIDEKKQIQHLTKVVKVLRHKLERLERVISFSRNQVTIQTGSASVELKVDGTIEIKGMNITLQAIGRINVKSDGTLTLKGAKIEEN